ncbi:MAG: hypothetical protein SNJ75_10265 [Gemmataceae bacterium]
MNAYRWLHQNDLVAMLDHIYSPGPQRLWRLWLAACLRWVMEQRVLEFDEQHVQMIDRLEQVADQNLPLMHMLASRATLTEDRPFWMALRTAQSLTLTRRELDDTLISLQIGLGPQPMQASPTNQTSPPPPPIHHFFCNFLRDVWGNPFDGVFLQPHWRTAEVRQLAEWIYRERCWQEMPYLADALLDAGCEDGRVLEHCRQAVHCRGCWLVDGLLGRRKP